ncbi:LPS biosynthesis-related glycosyltransferase [Ktedonobacter sp. SOSP1-52]|uniref:glycosyltransferase family 9 protein n=1 Tax=Ktedonobacter sp. SOSP1-52 TaxID=2778366 RepID=UPI0019156D95|nr:glycosyltransferase family 9 protein [Ktedonobacter sp. SOSP1-52]GHO70733.1 LPS biosynthesis-related glycosyltransferase [Ktedonobacter sp. SOSP1-52]
MYQQQKSRLTGIQKIAVLRANALGDFIFTLPALEALRSSYPEAEIVLLAKKWHQAFWHDRPGPVDRVVVVPPCAGVGEKETFQNDQEELERFFQAMRDEHFDLAIQLHGGGRYSNPFTHSLGARTTLGLKTPDAVALDRWVPYVYFQHEILRYLEVVSLVGATTTQLEPHVYVTPEDLQEAERVVPEQKKPLVILHPGAGDPRRRWAAERFAQVGDHLAALGMQVAVIGIGSEKATVESVLASMHTEALNLYEQLSLGGLAALFSRCRLVVSNDSGPVHLARAVGASTVGIYWCMNLVNSGPITSTGHRTCASFQMHCPVCGKDCMLEECEHQESFVNTVTLKEVLSAIHDLLEQ